VNVGNHSEDRRNERSQFGSFRKEPDHRRTARYSGLYLIEHNEPAEGCKKRF